MAITHRILAGAYTKDRLSRQEALALSKQIAPVLRRVTSAFELAGSYRRGNPSIGDLDFVTVDADFSVLLAKLTEKLGVTSAPRAGSGVMTVIMPFGRKKIQVEFVNVKARSFGSGLLHSTGSGEFNVGLRSYAKGKGLLLNQHGLFRDGKWIAGRTEEGVFKTLGLGFIPPEERNEGFSQLLTKYLVNPNAGKPKGAPAGKNSWRVKGTTGEVYTVTYKEGVWKCTCKGFQFRQMCRHIEAVQKKTGLK